MPELPEVETVVRYLKNNIINHKIQQVELRRDNLRHKLQLNFLTSSLPTTIVNIERMAKYIVITLDINYYLLIHLGMSGRLTIKPLNYNLQKHDHVIFHLDKARLLVFNDARRFGMISCIPHAPEQVMNFVGLGAEPLSDGFNAQYLATKLQNKKRPIKNILMDQKVVVGVGNIYASESLFLAGIHPETTGNSLNLSQIFKLVDAVKLVLEEAINMGGTTLKDFVGGDSKPGYFSQKLRVYARDNQLCYNCSSVINKIVQAGRSSFYCIKCQKIN